MVVLQRRGFLGAAGMVALGGAAPGFLARAAAAGAAKANGRALLVVELAGGNDGLNTVVPYGDDLYQKRRPGIGLKEGEVLKLDKYLGLHPRMTGFKKLYDEGSLAIVQGVGYPNPNRSHFRSMDIWHTANAETETVGDGWLGRALDASASRHHGKTPAIGLGSDRLPLALASGKVSVPAIRDLEHFKVGVGEGPRKDEHRRLMEKLAAEGGGDELAFIRRTATGAYDAARRLEAAGKNYKP
ncbi:MAG TPA: hypothetical protein VNC50_21290, partial [Planctomycetia bacterium]|nr:hypothetical protein [Planctomycetia bacterium]